MLLRSSVSNHPEDPSLIRVWFSYLADDPRTQVIVENIRNIPCRQYDRKLKCWAIPKQYREEALSILFNFADEVDNGEL